MKSVCSLEVINKFGELLSLEKNIQQKSKDVRELAKTLADYTEHLAKYVLYHMKILKEFD